MGIVRTTLSAAGAVSDTLSVRHGQQVYIAAEQGSIGTDWTAGTVYVDTSADLRHWARSENDLAFDGVAGLTVEVAVDGGVRLRASSDFAGTVDAVLQTWDPPGLS